MAAAATESAGSGIFWKNSGMFTDANLMSKEIY